MAAYTERGVLTTAYLISLAFDPSAATCDRKCSEDKALEKMLISCVRSVYAM